MAYLDEVEEKSEHYKYIEKRLTSRGLEINKKWAWEIHGPHQDMNYVVYVGLVKDGRMVVIYPKKVYEIDDESKWWDCDPEKIIENE
jgi:hypothetical protein